MEKKRDITLKDIARDTGFSITTISRVINRSNRFYSDETEQCILESVKRLNYKPNLQARGLRTGKTFSIAYLVPQLDDYYNNIYSGINDYMSRAGYSVSILSSDYCETQEKINIQHIINRHYDGVIVATGFLSKKINSHPQNIFGNNPLVMIECKNRGEEIAIISLNVRDVCRKTTEYLISLGHSRIAYLSAPARFDTLIERYDGYLDALAANQINLDESIVFFDQALERTDFDEFYKLMQRILNRAEFTAIIIMSDFAAVAALRVALELGINVPDDLSVVGFDNIPFTQFTTPTITTVAQNAYSVGSTSAEMLMDLIRGKPVSNRSLNCELIIRGSSGTVHN